MAAPSRISKAAQQEKKLRANVLHTLRSFSMHPQLHPSPPYLSYPKPRPVEDNIKHQKGYLQNLALRQNIELKKITLIVLFIFLGFETLAIFCFAFLQATEILGFSLEEWSFKLLVVATISQITFMLQVAVKHLFPASR